jgi:RNA polymerase sigma factor (sigma-70 family)
MTRRAGSFLWRTDPEYFDVDWVGVHERFDAYRKLPVKITVETMRFKDARPYRADILQELELQFWRCCIEFSRSRVSKEFSSFGPYAVQRLRWAAQTYMDRFINWRCVRVSLDAEISTAEGETSTNLDLFDDSLATEAHGANEDELRVIEKLSPLLDLLNDRDRQILQLHVVEGLSLAAVAKRMNLTLGTVKNYHAWALTKMREAATA